MLVNAEKQNRCFIWCGVSLFPLALSWVCLDQRILNEHSSVIQYRLVLLWNVYILWVSGNKILTFPWRFSPNTTSRRGKRKAAAGAALGLQHLGSTLTWLEPVNAAVRAWSLWPSGWTRAVVFWGWSLGGGRGMQWPSEVLFFPGYICVWPQKWWGGGWGGCYT